MVLSCRVGNRTSWKFFWSDFPFIPVKVTRGSLSLSALSDSPVKLVTSILSVWGKGGADTTLLKNCGASQIKNSKVSLKGTKNPALTRHERNSFQGGSLVKSMIFDWFPLFLGMVRQIFSVQLYPGSLWLVLLFLKPQYWYVCKLLEEADRQHADDSFWLFYGL